MINGVTLIDGLIATRVIGSVQVVSCTGRVNAALLFGSCYEVANGLTDREVVDATRKEEKERNGEQQRQEKTTTYHKRPRGSLRDSRRQFTP